MADAIEFLQAQHRAAERLFAAYWAAPAAGDQRPLLLELADVLTAHSTIEERHFYPALRSDETNALLEDSYDDHRELKEIILHLLDVGPLDETFSAELEQLQARIQEHVAVEERELFPRARSLLGAERLARLAAAMTATMKELHDDGPAHEHLAAEMGR
jgi:hemerythrin superfamily protein